MAILLSSPFRATARQGDASARQVGSGAVACPVESADHLGHQAGEGAQSQEMGMGVGQDHITSSARCTRIALLGSRAPWTSGTERGGCLRVAREWVGESR
jgi:hypothetical protein